MSPSLLIYKKTLHDRHVPEPYTFYVCAFQLLVVHVLEWWTTSFGADDSDVFCVGVVVTKKRDQEVPIPPLFLLDDDLDHLFFLSISFYNFFSLSVLGLQLAD